MVSQTKLDEFDAYALLKSLGNFLEAGIEVSSGIIERKAPRGDRRETIQYEGHTIKVTVRNTAPTESNWPVVVFTGVGLEVKFKRVSVLTSMKRHMKVDLTNAPQSNPFPRSGVQRIDGFSFPYITSDEKRHGYVLYPGESIIYEMNVTNKGCPDINDMNFWVEGNVSRRHLLHFNKELVPSSG